MESHLEISLRWGNCKNHADEVFTLVSGIETRTLSWCPLVSITDDSSCNKMPTTTREVAAFANMSINMHQLVGKFSTLYQPRTCLTPVLIVKDLWV